MIQYGLSVWRRGMPTSLQQNVSKDEKNSTELIILNSHRLNCLLHKAQTKVYATKNCHPSCYIINKFDFVKSMSPGGVTQHNLTWNVIISCVFFIGVATPACHKNRRCFFKR